MNLNHRQDSHLSVSLENLGEFLVFAVDWMVSERILEFWVFLVFVVNARIVVLLNLMVLYNICPDLGTSNLMIY